MKKVTITLILIYIMCYFCACGSNPSEDIIGYWMRGDGYTISFVDDTTCSLGESAPQTYKIYDENHLQIVDLTGNGVSEFVFEVDDDVLKIRLATEEGYTEFTKDEVEQKKILEELKVWEAIALEEQMLQEQIDSIQEQIDSYRNEVTDIQKKIDWNNSAIENNKADIIRWEEAIEQAYIDCQESIDFGDDEEYQKNQRDSFVKVYNESIQSCNDRIVDLEEKNVGYQESIDSVLKKIKELEGEIEKLQK